jgi:hypothetical protein
MAVPVEINNLMLGSVSGYQISRSVRFRASATAYFNRTFGTPTSQNTWTLSFWTKRGTLGTQVDVFSAGTANRLEFLFATTNTFQISDASTTFITTNAVFRDPSAWYHIVVRANGSGSALQVYVNGVVTTNSTTNNLTTSYWNASGTVGYIGSLGGFSSNYYDGYLTEINFVDGQALTPSSFGEYDTITGVWEPKKYTGTYGTNGFYLNFSDNSASTAAAIGKDYSGNGNNWTPNNISVTAGVTYDSMIDSPTSFPDGSTGRGNYAVLNPINTNSFTITGGNLNGSVTGGTAKVAVGTIGVSSGKWYWEVVGTSGINLMIGVANSAVAITSSSWTTASGWAYYLDGQKFNNNTGVAYGSSYVANDIIGVALDMDTGTLVFYKNNTSQGTAFNTGLSGKTIVPAIFNGSSGNTQAYSINFGQRPFTYTPPSGFLALNTQNLPDATIKNGASYMAATLYTGNATVRSITNGGNNTIGTTFQPDFVWIKSRTPTAWSHELFDALRGALNYLSTNLTAANQVEATSLTAFNSNGFSTGVWAPINGSGESLVAWQWNAGGSTVTNTSGSISAQVRANPTAGFSIVTYTGTGANATVGHGLGVAPSMYVCKIRSGVNGWIMYHVSTGNTQFMTLNDTVAAQTAATVWNSTTPTSSVFSLGSSGGVNNSASTYVAYCFSAVAGYSAFGSYTGNASTDGPFVFTGFRPRWLMIKNSSSAGDDWILFDSSRDTYNVTNLNLRANTSGAESTQSANYLDFLSNGFKIRGTSAGTINASQTYIYAAFAENPFKYSLAR